MRRLLALVAAIAAAAVMSPAAQANAAAGEIVEVTGFGSDPGDLRMLRAVPEGLPAGAPIVVALHGCTQNGTDYGTDTGWLSLANERGFALVLPEQRAGNNLNGCFNWFESGDTGNGGGEAESIAQMVARTVADTGADPARVYVTGLSAGGAMTAAMLAAYPDVFAGGAVVAGLPFGCATSAVQAFTCMNPGTDKTPAQWGDLVRAAGSGTGASVAVWHGDADYTVAVANQRELADQWTDVRGVAPEPTGSDTVAGFPHEVYGEAVETYRITGMGHGQPVDPAGGCGTAAAFVLDVGLCAAGRMADTWAL
ncbi:esterase [Amycolatopsis antarctica]|uniref:Esterase n=1 Tax=Amycolatopsis antarctica TaxID=1854586 RepID=A0A263CYE9_9PSEU|nr:PHB depolymerase family esterase [Amycolatopsis antarctica]OZM70999.1 esterase [Amycolatopsis antarctica]